jgi:hypothetical protein
MYGNISAHTIGVGDALRSEERQENEGNFNFLQIMQQENGKKLRKVIMSYARDLSDSQSRQRQKLVVVLPT